MAASDVDAPYAVAPRPVPGPHYGPGPRYGYGPSLLPSTEVYSVLRDNGFSPLGIPRLRGFVYTIAVIDRGGEDGRLVIDARNGRIIRFMPAYRMGGDNYYEEQSALHGPLRRSAAAGASAAGPAPDQVQAAPRAVTAGPCREPRGADAEGQPARRQTRRRRRSSRRQRLRRSRPRCRRAAPVTTGSAPAKPAPQIAPTQDMPTVQGLE